MKDSTNTPIKPMSVSRWCTMWEHDGYFERINERVVKIFQPLRTEAPEDAQPSIQFNSYIDFWKPRGSQDRDNPYYDREVKYIDMCSVSPILAHVDGKWRECAGGKVEWFEPWQKWCMTWHCYSNTRMAHMMNAGMPVFTGEKEMQENY